MKTLELDVEAGFLSIVSKALKAYAERGVPIPGWQAAALAEVLDRTARGDVGKQASATEIKNRAIALSYAIRLELAPGTSKKIAHEISTLYGGKPSTVPKAASEHRAFVNFWLAKLGENVKYEGLGRHEMLKRELASIESWLPKPTMKR